MTDDHASLFALASHFAGDFPLQPDWMAARKLDEPVVRAQHVTVYTAAFLPYTLSVGWDDRQRGVFFALLWGSHFLVDSRRWHDGVPFWFDQALHVICLALFVAVVERWGEAQGA